MAKKKKKESPLSKLTNSFKFQDLLGGETLYFLIGLAILLMSVFMLIAFSSLIVSGANDQSILESSDPDIHEEINNVTGYWGAKMAYFFMNDCFGIAAYFIPLFFFFCSMKLMKT